MGNVVGDSADGDARIEFVFIDFEKSVALRPFPNIKSAMIDPRRLWPSDLLGQMLTNEKPLMPPGGAITRIKALNEEACRILVQPVSDALGGIAWAQDCVDAVAKRANKIQSLAEEVWT